MNFQRLKHLKKSSYIIIAVLALGMLLAFLSPAFLLNA